MLFQKTLLFLLVICITSISLSGIAISGKKGPMTKKILKNGLTAIVKESHRAPVVAVQIWVKAGSTYETEQQAGITHLIEHMIFKGSEKYPAGELASTIETLGGTINAYTSYDYTVYHCVVPSDHLDTALEILQDAVFHPAIDPQELAREKEVVLEEMRMRNDRPESRLFEELMRISYEKAPYRRPIIGYENTVKSFTRDDILNYMAQRYRPVHMAIVVTGDIDSRKAMKLIEQRFEKEPEKPGVKMIFPEEPVQQTIRFSREEMDCQQAHLAISFSGLPSFDSADTPTLDLLGALLSDGESSRLVLSLKNRKQLVTAIDAAAFTPAGPGLFEVSATLDPKNIEKALEEIFYQIYRIKFSEISQDELEKAKTQVVTSFVFAQETMEGEARKIGVFQMLTGDAANASKYIQQVQAVTPEDLKMAAIKYFKEKNVNISLLLPENVNIGLTRNRAGNLIETAYERAMGVDNITAAKHQSSKIKRFILSNGATVLALEAHEVPSFAIQIIFPGGVRAENRVTNGLFNLMAETWTQGTINHSAEALADMIDSMGGSISGFSGQNTFGLSARFTSHQFHNGLQTVAEILLTPTFPREEVEKQKTIVLAKLKQQQDNMPRVAILEFKRLLFSPHPYSLNSLGTPEVIKRLTSQDLKRCWQEYAVPRKAVISVVGDFNTEELKKTLETLLADWKDAGTPPIISPPAPEQFASPKTRSILRDKEQEHIILGFFGPAMDSDDRYPMEVLNAVLAGQGGRLFKDLRDQHSLAYAVTSFLQPGINYGMFACYIGCAPDKKKAAVSGIWRNLYMVREEPITEEELERAKNWLIGRYQIGLQTHGARALEMGLNQLYGLGIDFPEKYAQRIRAVTSETVKKVARKYIDPEAYVLVEVGP